MSQCASELFPIALRDVATGQCSFLGKDGKSFGSADAVSDRS